jgi:microcin C transport system permease protein
VEILIRVLLLVGVFALGWVLTHRLLPWAWVRVGRLLGFRMQLTPLTERRVRKFKKIRRGYVCFVLITTAFVTSLFFEMVINHKPLYVRYGTHWQSPALANWVNFWLPFAELGDTARWEAFGLTELGQKELNGRRYAAWVDDPALLETEALAIEERIARETEQFRAILAQNARDRGLVYDAGEPLPEHKVAEFADAAALAAAYRRLKGEVEAGESSVVMPPYPFSPSELLLHLEGFPPYPVFWKQARSSESAGAAAIVAAAERAPLLGTDFAGRDVLSQLAYGFRISFAFAILVAFIGYGVGVTVGGIMGYFGGWVDILVQRFIEVWSSIPFLYTIMILGGIVEPTFFLLAALLIVLRGWVGITYTVRGEFYREKSRDYTAAARAIGVRDFTIMMRHILPNSLVPVVTFLPFSIVAFIGALVSLDYLNFGLPPSIPSWGRLLRQGADNIVNYPELVLLPVTAVAVTLFCVVMIGEAVREAFDPREYARLR